MHSHISKSDHSAGPPPSFLDLYSKNFKISKIRDENFFSPIKNFLPSTLNTEVISKTYFLLRYYVLCIALIVDVDYIFNKNLTFGH